jgi:hypothetical protein
MAGSALGTLLRPSPERSLLVSESSEWKGSAGAGTPSVGRLKEGVGGPAYLIDSGDEAAVEG